MTRRMRISSLTNGTSSNRHGRVSIEINLGDAPTVAQTRVEPSCTSAVYDERFSFSFGNVSGELADRSIARVVDDLGSHSSNDCGCFLSFFLPSFCASSPQHRTPPAERRRVTALGRRRSTKRVMSY